MTGNLEKQYTKSTHTKNIEQGSVSQKVRKSLSVFTGPMNSCDDVFSKCNFFKALKLGLNSCTVIIQNFQSCILRLFQVIIIEIMK